MHKLFIKALHTEDPGREEPAATRDRLKAFFPPGSVRRMTQLGLMVGYSLEKIGGLSCEPMVYASIFGEGRSLEAYLDSFPDASPTLFQTDIHPSGAQQGLIARKQPVTTFIPLSGGPHLAGQALINALLCPEPTVMLCGGDEKGTWLSEHGAASDVGFAFALALEHAASPGQLGCLKLTRNSREEGGLDLHDFFQHLHSHSPYSGPAAPGWDLEISWL
ncbi:MAG: hypothetical protein WC378_03260 [Opitutaceae bacterium]